MIPCGHCLCSQKVFWCYLAEGQATKHNSWLKLIVRVSLFCLTWLTVSAVGGTLSWSRSVGRKLLIGICSQSYCQDSSKPIQAKLDPAVRVHCGNPPCVYLLNEHRKVDAFGICLFWASGEQQSWTCCSLCRQEGFFLGNTGICTNLFISLECTLSFLT